MPNPQPIRVVVVDDSLFMRGLVRSTLEAEPDMEVVGTASNGKRGVEEVERLQPDLVVLDLEMPVMDGVTALDHIREQRPNLPAIIFTATEPRHAEMGLRVLAMANTTWITKTPNGGEPGGGLGRRRDLVANVRTLMGRRSPDVATPAPAAPAAPLPRANRPKRAAGAKYSLLAIGTSTGGPDALAAVVTALPGDLSVPVVIVQHMPPQFTKHLADRLDSKSALSVCQGTAGEPILPGNVYLAPGGYHMVLERKGLEVRIATNQEPLEHSCRPAVDPLFRSAADIYGSGVLAVILTGMGSDGSGGCAAISDAGGRILIQDEASSVVWGMPGEISRLELQDREYPLDQMAFAITNELNTGAKQAR